MTISFSIDHTAGSTESVAVEVAEKTNMVLQSTSTDPKTGEVVTTYVLSSGDNSYPADVIYRASLQKRSTGMIRRVSCTFDTWATKSDSVSGIDTKKPFSGTISVNMPADVTIEVADADKFLGSLFSFLFDHVDAGVRDTTWLAKLLFGIPQVK